MSSAPHNTVIIGASGGIGRALVHRCAARGDRVTALSRSGITFDYPNVTSGQLDMTSETEIKHHADTLQSGDPITILIVATGFLHDAVIGPEKSLRDLSFEGLERNFAINTIGPAMILKHFLPLMPRKERAVAACLSARVGSIGDNRLGGWYAYRASKAALNMLIKTCSVEQARRAPEHVIIGLHPGTVDTELSRPFQRNVPEGKLFDADFSAECLLKIIDEAPPEHSGQVFAWDGQIIAH